MNLTAHFTWDEVARSPTATRLGLANAIPDALQANAIRVGTVMEAARSLLGVPIRVTSWYRAPAVNAAIGGVPTSAHMKGLAVDWQPLGGLSLDAAFDAVAAQVVAWEVDQLIIERTGDGAAWIHLGLSNGPARHEVLRARGAKLGGKMGFERVAVG